MKVEKSRYVKKKSRRRWRSKRPNRQKISRLALKLASSFFWPGGNRSPGYLGHATHQSQKELREFCVGLEASSEKKKFGNALEFPQPKKFVLSLADPLFFPAVAAAAKKQKAMKGAFYQKRLVHFFRSKYPVSMSAWHKIHFMRTSRLGFLTVDEQETQAKMSDGAFNELSLTQQLYLGGVPTFRLVSPFMPVRKAFKGCVQEVGKKSF